MDSVLPSVPRHASRNGHPAELSIQKIYQAREIKEDKPLNPKQTKTAEQQLEILSRGTKDFIGRDLLLKKLKSGQILKVKAGFDPSRPDLHLGHSLLINKLRQFQELGHDVIFVVGDWTACIGDPSGQNKTRPALKFEESRKNAQSYKDQACKKNFTFRPHHASRSGHPAELSIQPDFNKDSEKIFNFFKRLDPQKTKIVFNSEWFEKLSLRDFVLKIASKHTLARQLERDDFKKRFKENQAIALHELFYPLLQAYDSVKLEADVEIGGTDQLFNLLLGRQLQESLGQAPQTILTLPLLEGLGSVSKDNWNITGADKMSKSLGNAISFTDSPKDMYGKIMSLSDKLLVRWWNLFTDWGEENKINSFDSDYINFKAKKEELAWLLVCSFYGDNKANKEQETFKKERTEKKIPEDMPEKLHILPQDISQDKAGNLLLDELLIRWRNLSIETVKAGQTIKEKEIFTREPSEKSITEEGMGRVFSNTGVDQNIELVDLLLKLKLVSSKSEARRKILEEAVRILEYKINNSKEESKEKSLKMQSNENINISRNQMKKFIKPNEKLSIQRNQEVIVSVGKRNFGRFNAWIYVDDLKVFKLYKELQKIKEKLSKDLSEEEDFKKAGISSKSIKGKLEKYMKIDKYMGLDKYIKFGAYMSIAVDISEQSKKIFQKYKEHSILDIEKAIEKKKIENKNNFKEKKENQEVQWDYIHDLKVYLVYRKIKEAGDENKILKELFQRGFFKGYVSEDSIKKKMVSIKMKIANYRYLDNKGGLSHVSKQSKEIYEKYKGYSIAELEEEIKRLETEKPNKGKG